jgi:CRISPR-associated protein Cas2
MPRKKKTVSFAERMLKLYRSGLPKKPVPPADIDGFPSLDERIKHILGIVNHKHNNLRMLFFVMYDIEDNRVRHQVGKYLLRKGCSRIQKSIFLCDAAHAVYAQIKDDLTDIQECYENHDSIILVPISTDYLQAMRIIGKNVDVDIILKNKNTLFF